MFGGPRHLHSASDGDADERPDDVFHRGEERSGIASNVAETLCDLQAGDRFSCRPEAVRYREVRTPPKSRSLRDVQRDAGRRPSELATEVRCGVR